MPDAGFGALVELPLSIVLFVGVFVIWLVAGGALNVRVDYALLLATAAVLVPLHLLTRRLAEARRRRASAGERRELTRDRFVAGLLSPLVAISIVPAVACAWLGAANNVVVVSLFNALASSGEVLLALLILWQAPRSARVRRRRAQVEWR